MIPIARPSLIKVLPMVDDFMIPFKYQSRIRAEYLKGKERAIHQEEPARRSASARRLDEEQEGSHGYS
jgi:hypothetical protein